MCLDIYITSYVYENILHLMCLTRYFFFLQQKYMYNIYDVYKVVSHSNKRRKGQEPEKSKNTIDIHK